MKNYDSLFDLNKKNINEMIYIYFDYLLRIDTKDYKSFLYSIYNKYNYNLYTTIICGILKNLSTILNHTKEELNSEKDFNNKKYTLYKFRQIKNKYVIVYDFYQSKLENNKVRRKEFNFKK